MPNLNALKETRAAKRDELRPLGDKVLKGEALNDDEVTRFNALDGEIRSIDTALERAERYADLERRAHAEPIGGGVRDMDDLAARYNPAKALAEFTDSGKLTGAEAEFAAERRSGRPGAIAMPTNIFLGGERRALTTAAPVAGPGGNLVATNQGAFIDRVRPVLATESLGATVLRDLTGNLDLPRFKASGTAYWVAEHTNVTRSDPQFDKVSMGPKTVGAEYEVSRRMLLQTTALEPILRNDLSYLLREALDRAAIVGGGTNEPDGILSLTGLTVLPIGTNGGALTIGITADMIGAVDDAASGTRGFLVNPATRTAVLKMVDGDGLPIGLSTVFHNEPVAFSRALPNDGTKGTGEDLSAIVYGVWSDLIIGYWSAVDIVPNPYHADVASKGGLLLHAFLDADVAARHVESFVAVTDVVTA